MIDLPEISTSWFEFDEDRLPDLWTKFTCTLAVSWGGNGGGGGGGREGTDLVVLLLSFITNESILLKPISTLAFNVAKSDCNDFRSSDSSEEFC